MKYGKISLIFIFALLISCSGGKAVKDSQGNDMRGRAEGWAKIYDDDMALARDRALDDARKKLVEKILGRTVTGKSIVENYRLVSAIFEAKTFGLVRDEVIVKEWREGDIFKVIIEGTVEPAAIDDIITKALKDYGRPKFMVLLTETIDGKKSSPGNTETEYIIYNIMGNAGFEFVDADTVKGLMKREKSRMATVMKGAINDDIKEFLLDKVGAEVIITGEALVTDQTKLVQKNEDIKDMLKGMTSMSAIVRLKAIDVYTGKILTADSTQAPAIHIDPATAAKNALEANLKKTLGKKDSNGRIESGPFINTMAIKFVEATTHRQINVAVAGLEYSDMTKFRNEISHRIRGVQEVISKGQTGAYASLEVYFAGKTTDFADELAAKSQNLGFEVKIIDSYPNRLRITAKRIK